MHLATSDWRANRLRIMRPRKWPPAKSSEGPVFPGELVSRHGVQWNRGRAHLTSLRARRWPPVDNHRRLVPQNIPAARGPVYGGV